MSGGERNGDGRPAVAVTLGDPGGIGPEVVVKALADRALRARARFRLLGAASALGAAAERARIEPYWWRVHHASPVVGAGGVQDVVVLDYEAPEEPAREPTRAGGEVSFRCVEDAIASSRLPAGDARRVEALVTGPISKLAWQMAGHGQYPGHTDLLAVRLGAKRTAMMFESPVLRVVLATAHVPLMDLRNVLTIGRVFDAIDLGHEACLRLGVVGPMGRPRLAVCGLNPHAGEGGILGDEESRLIEPAIRAACEAGIDVRGPFPGDTIFRSAVRRHGRAEFDLVVAMYHDQGLIPVKLLARDEAVNLTLGLPVPRTSPDHGTAFDIAGQNRAEPGSMRAAIELAVRLAEAGRREGSART